MVCHEPHSWLVGSEPKHNWHYRTYREKRNRIINFSGAPYMVLVVGRISTLTSLCYKKKGMAAKSASISHVNKYSVSVFVPQKCCLEQF